MSRRFFFLIAIVSRSSKLVHQIANPNTKVNVSQRIYHLHNIARNNESYLFEYINLETSSIVINIWVSPSLELSRLLKLLVIISRKWNWYCWYWSFFFFKKAVQSKEHRRYDPNNNNKKPKQSLQVPDLCIWSQDCHLDNLRWTCTLVLQIVPDLKLQYMVQYPSTTNFVSR